ncbi:ArsR/SmtB family transcription factor [Amycolatopsis suaedae]|uniref:ArsR family transcriptional regulator n=1 Tax=Amycolatopsis suaedae TaxID=2510978 RepID=A0A4Q7J0R5_9PSEU|nr:metalloregulator ArsR/SmtB family transcription factor [Amycolatopsis suaedae]RZQ60162.1 ArsR family transcriptional regulator [Amycolatopsis suaedae]
MPTATDVYQAIADPTRRTILDLLAEGDRSAGTLAESFRMSRPAVSQHLKVLREAGLVSEQRSGRQRIYHLEPDGLAEVARWLSYYQRFWHARFAALGEYLDAQETDE